MAMSERETVLSQAKFGELIEFPRRHFFSVRILRDAESWLLLAGEHGWAHGDERSALADAEWLAANLSLPVREGRTVA
jgi:hypothetical protein